MHAARPVRIPAPRCLPTLASNRLTPARRARQRKKKADAKGCAGRQRRQTRRHGDSMRIITWSSRAALAACQQAADAPSWRIRCSCVRQGRAAGRRGQETGEVGMHLVCHCSTGAERDRRVCCRHLRGRRHRNCGHFQRLQRLGNKSVGWAPTAVGEAKQTCSPEIND
jgi:hypothetical protein